jgi:PadR family transcriptional regulator PadR
MATTPPRSEWLRGVLELCVLRTLAGGPTYGYAIAAELAEAGFGDIKGGTLYPLLGRLERDALVTVEWRAGEGGPGRKYFALTAAGRAALEEGAAQWHAFATTVDTHLSPTPARRR